MAAMAADEFIPDLFDGPVDLPRPLDFIVHISPLQEERATKRVARADGADEDTILHFGEVSHLPVPGRRHARKRHPALRAAIVGADLDVRGDGGGRARSPGDVEAELRGIAARRR